MRNSYVLQTDNLTRAYRMGKDEVTALCDVSLQIMPGEFVAIMGPSGSGKSTLLNLLGGLDTPTRGEVLLNGQPLAGLKENESAALRRHTLGFIFQGYDLFPVLTALENVMFPLLVAGVPMQERLERAQSLLAKVGLSDKTQHFPDELSGGQQQRVGIARALASHPLVLLADEPTGNLDSATASEILNLLMALVEDEGLTLVMVTHDPDSARRAHRILRLKDGHLEREKVQHD
ncbi:MAG: ATP-binding cassette domain-containing protein [Anaerolineaceae bacterium]|nr:ATP-binding cassette domain-containing protein [Anaerolineaceae bacterium]